MSCKLSEFCIFTINKAWKAVTEMNSTAESIDIIIPCKNAGPFLNQCLESIQKQTIQDWNCWVIDDHSTDDSKQITQAFEAKDYRIKALNNKGRGIIDALQTGISQVKGTFLTRMDADDVMAPNKLETLRSLLRTNGQGCIACGKVQYFSNKKLGEGYQKYETWINEMLQSTHPFQGIYKECIIPSPSWMLWRTDFNAIGGFSQLIYPEDYDFAFKVYKAKFRILHTDDIVHFWRDYPDRTSRTDPNYADNRFLQLKVQHFLDIDYAIDQNLILWGAGKKGKQIAKLLIVENIAFQWISNNPKKIGHNIYHQIIKSDDLLPPNSQVIIAVAAPKEVKSIKEKLANITDLDVYFFA